MSLPIVAMERYLADIERDLGSRWPEAQLFAYGHLADGNLHLVVAPRPTEVGADAIDRATRDAWQTASDEIVYAPLEPLGGSVSAEHGIGLVKKAHLARSRTPEEIRLMGALKGLLDPRGILNPGKIV